MKRSVIAVILLVLVFALGGCAAITAHAGSACIYDNAERYSAGDAEFTERVESLDIEWISGNVRVVTAKQDSVTVSETVSGQISDDLRVHTFLDGSALRVRFRKSGLNAGTDSKDLTVTIPEGTALSSLKIESALGDITIDSVTADTCEIETAMGTAETIGADFRELKIESASGDTKCGLARAPENAAISSAAGSVTVSLPKDAGLTLKTDLAVGSIHSDFSMAKVNERYVIGDGSGKMKIEVAVGDINLKAN